MGNKVRGFASVLGMAFGALVLRLLASQARKPRAKPMKVPEDIIDAVAAWTTALRPYDGNRVGISGHDLNFCVGVAEVEFMPSLDIEICHRESACVVASGCIRCNPRERSVYGWVVVNGKPRRSVYPQDYTHADAVTPMMFDYLIGRIMPALVDIVCVETKDAE